MGVMDDGLDEDEDDDNTSGILRRVRPLPVSTRPLKREA
jgi:hypothetical protein